MKNDEIIISRLRDISNRCKKCNKEFISSWNELNEFQEMLPGEYEYVDFCTSAKRHMNAQLDLQDIRKEIMEFIGSI
jgi:hypothetical protein